MKFGKAILFGVMLWAVIFILVCAFVGFKAYDSRWIHILTAVIAGVLSLVFADIVKPRSVIMALGYGFTWVVIGVILDAIITIRFNPAIFMSRLLWAGYVLVLLAPLLRVKKV